MSRRRLRAKSKRADRRRGYRRVVREWEAILTRYEACYNQPVLSIRSRRKWAETHSGHSYRYTKDDRSLQEKVADLKLKEGQEPDRIVDGFLVRYALIEESRHDYEGYSDSYMYWDEIDDRDFDISPNGTVYVDFETHYDDFDYGDSRYGYDHRTLDYCHDDGISRWLEDSESFDRYPAEEIHEREVRQDFIRDRIKTNINPSGYNRASAIFDAMRLRSMLTDTVHQIDAFKEMLVLEVPDCGNFKGPLPERRNDDDRRKADLVPTNRCCPFCGSQRGRDFGNQGTVPS